MNQIISIIFILLLHSLQTTPLQTTSVCGEPVTEIKSCVTNIRQQPLLYESCKARPCFVFTGQPPHVLLGDSISPLPFQCGNSQLANLSIDGTVFRIMNVTEIGKELCIYSAYCSISQLISWSYFMAQYGYQFVVVNMLMDLPERRCHHSPSIGFYTDELVIVSRKKSRIFEMISSAWENVSKCIGYLVLSMLPIFSFLYMRKRWERTGITPTKNRNERNGQLWINVRFASSIYLFAVLLSLELLFVNWTNRGEERHRPLSIMAKMEVSKFAVPAGTGIETIFKLRGKYIIYSLYRVLCGGSMKIYLTIIVLFFSFSNGSTSKFVQHSARESFVVPLSKRTALYSNARK